MVNWCASLACNPGAVTILNMQPVTLAMETEQSGKVG